MAKIKGLEQGRRAKQSVRNVNIAQKEGEGGIGESGCAHARTPYLPALHGMTGGCRLEKESGLQDRS